MEPNPDDYLIGEAENSSSISLDTVAEVVRQHFAFLHEPESAVGGGAVPERKVSDETLPLSVQPLVGYVDANFRITSNGSKAILKIAGQSVDESEVSYRSALLTHLSRHANDVPVPRTLPTGSGSDYDRSGLVSGRFVQMFSFLPGRPLADVNPQNRASTAQVGKALAKIDKALLTFEHPAMNRYFEWDLSHFLDFRERFTEHSVGIPSEIRTAITSAFEWFAAYTDDESSRGKKQQQKSVIHGDGNDHNLLFHGFDDGVPKLSGVLDFGDSSRSELVNESAIALAYLMMGKRDPLAHASAFVSSYCDVLPLSPGELANLIPLVKCRLSTTIVQAAKKQRDNPADEYYQISAEPARTLLLQLESISLTLCEMILREAAGLEPHPRSQRVCKLLASVPVAAILDKPFSELPVRVVDLSVDSDEGESIEAATSWQNVDVAQFPKREVDSAGRRFVSIGQYDEVRAVYSADQFVCETDAGDERRSVHLGIDVFGPPGMTIRTPLDGDVYGLADNDAALDYGPTVILSHTIEGEKLFSLFGHLSRASLSGMEVGQRLRAGDVVGEVGDQAENGGWAPHLHFQLMLDMLGESNNFPGVARPSMRRVMTSSCPDPNLLLRIPMSKGASSDRTVEDISRSRREHLGPNLSLSYNEPLHIVRGSGAWLTSSNGQRYLDCVNNVCHVGHCHPRVVDAIVRQVRILNTNTRYLHQTIIDYAEMLTARLPDPLSVCFLVCSGSEANDLALRMARTFTGRKGVVALDSGYHGHLTSLVNVSSYKFAGPGGAGAPAYVELADMPDPFRARDGAGSTTFADSVGVACKRLDQKGMPPAAFIAETILSCGGQVEPPEGYLRAAYGQARDAGAICIADEVQTGFGRMGTHFWAFETQGVVPEIVTMGKPIGNGHPIAAVVTTREIADTFNNGMEYFNTYGGNPVSCAAAKAVLEVIDEEELQQNALEVGRYFIERLSELKDRFTLIGDVRGRGLFLGIELVTDRETLEPAAAEASYLVNRLRAFGLLLSTDGPLHNVIKIKPPMVFSRSDVDLVITGMARVFEEDFMMGIGR